MTLILDSVVATHVGLVRSNNEDAAFAGRHLVAVADGIGGLPAGELASQIVITALRVLDAAERVSDPAGLLAASVEAANRRIQRVAAADPAREGMGTTVTALLLQGTRLGLFHVGDSRCYHYRDGVLRQVTKDDTFVQTLVDEGFLEPEEARFHPRRSVVTQAVQGVEYRPTIEVLTPRAGDRFLLCSDGLSDMVSDEEMLGIVGRVHDVQACAEALVECALAAGGLDNVTIVVADVVTSPA
jgi:protein phosphatase